MIKRLFIGFKGVNNASNKCVSLIDNDTYFLTNSFKGIDKDIELIKENYDEIILVGLNSKLKDKIVIETRAKLQDEALMTSIDVETLSKMFTDCKIKNNISNKTSNYFCNYAFFKLLKKFNGKVVLIHIPSKNDFPLKVGKTINLLNLEIKDIMVSQFYVSKEKIDNVSKWFNSNDLSNFEPIPIKVINDTPVMLDGHSRTVVGLLNGLKKIPLVYEKDEWDWEMYSRCIEESKNKNINSPYDLLDRIISKDEYVEKWDKWCDKMQEEINSFREQEKIRKELKCIIYPLNHLKTYKYVVICSRYKDKWVLSKHKKRNTYETQGGHIEANESCLDSAKRELYEESGIKDATMYPVCDYYGYNNKSHSNGMVFLAIVHSLGTLPESEIEKVELFEKLPENLTYPNVSPKLYEEAKKLFDLIKMKK